MSQWKHQKYLERILNEHMEKQKVVINVEPHWSARAVLLVSWSIMAASLGCMIGCIVGMVNGNLWHTVWVMTLIFGAAAFVLMGAIMIYMGVTKR